MNKKRSPKNDSLAPFEEYFKKKSKSLTEEDEPYFPLEESKPPHY
tara:strand:+ start:318 stop:452 length:135 start_codon:yes stop_codon:yes gene_type:complete